MTGRTRVVLVGAGHTHLHLIARGRALAEVGVDLVVLAPATFHYSGLAIATATGVSPPGANRIDVAALCARQDVLHHDVLVDDLDLDGRQVRTDDGTWHAYDRISFNVGSAVPGPPVPTGDEVLRVKPLASLDQLPARLAALADRDQVRISIVGAGATGCELAAHLGTRLGGRERTTVHDRGDGPVPAFPLGARRRVHRRLRERGVRFDLGAEVVALHDAGVTTTTGTTPADLVVLATGLQPSPLGAQLGLGDGRGIPVRATLQHVDHDEVLAVGDCAHFTPRPLPKVGVYGVRAAPVLADVLVALHQRRTPPEFAPQRRALQILDVGDGVSVGARGRWWTESRWMHRLKLRIDHAWLDRYR